MFFCATYISGSGFSAAGKTGWEECMQRLKLALAFVFALCALSLPQAALCASGIEGSTLRVVAAYGNKEAIFAEFEKVSGVKVEFLDLSSGEALARFKAEKGKPMADIWFGGGLDSFVAAKTAGLLEAYASPEAGAIDAKYRDKDGTWCGVSLVTVCFMVNEKLCKEKGIDPPKSWSDLLDPKLKGEVSMANPAISGTTYAVVSELLQSMGQEKGWAYFKALAANVPFFAKRGGEPPKKAAMGEAVAGISPASGEFFKLSKDYPVVGIYPADGVPWTVAPVSILKGARNLDAAKAFVDWALSEQGQATIVKADPRPPVRTGMAAPDGLGDFQFDKLLDIDLEKACLDRETVLKEWQAELGL